jgi:tetratricopeptide (TPR) repeat protein
MTEPIVQSVASLILRINSAASQGDYAEAQAIARQAVEQAERSLHQPSRAAAHYTLATMLWSDETASASEARDHARQALDLALSYTDDYFLALTLLARVEAGLGNLSQARALTEQLLEAYRRKDRQRGIADALRSFGDLALRENDLPAARQYFEEGLVMYRTEIRDPLNQAGLLLSFGSLAYREGNTEEARQRWDEASQLGIDHDLPQVVALARRSLSILATDDPVEDGR